MNARLYGARGISDDSPERARKWIKREGGEVIKTKRQRHRDGTSRTQFTVSVDGETWYLRPFGPGGTYSWMRVR